MFQERMNMKLTGNPEAKASVAALAGLGLIRGHEVEAVGKLGAASSPFAQAVEHAETIHLHIKVDDTHRLPINEFFKAGARLDHQKDGFVKWRFPGGVNAIFSHIKVSQDELLETPATRRARPFLDHIGIDLRDETDPVRRVFDRLPETAEALAWRLASQGGPGKPVYCCHMEVAEKHWVYPPDEAAGRPGIPLEFAYGALKVNPDKSGCDLRPADPGKVDPAALAAVSCCGAEGGHAPAANHEPTVQLGGGSEAYYRSADLGRFGEIARVNPELGAEFFSYYNRVMADGLLTKREKALIALAVAHALKCPYCIDAYTGTLQKMGVKEAEMGEAAHVAGAMAAGITLVHSVQMMNRFERKK
jgi:alkylhydroperoxidase/carboxymuconolactone decarboxylase family protein